MEFWIFMFIMNLLIPLTMIGFGKFFMNWAPKNINMFFGYRTSMSMKNLETWKFAHKHSGKIWFNWGLIIFAITTLIMFFIINNSKDSIAKISTIICIFQLVFLIISIFPTEIALRKNFDKNGNKK